MKEIHISSGEVVLVDDDDYEKLKVYTWRISDGYAVTGGNNGDFISMHRLIMNTPSDMLTDHKDMNKINNQKANLRICTRQQNACNSPPPKSNKSGYKGVSWDKDYQKWFAKIRYNYKAINLGRYTTKEEAARAYDKAAVKYFGEFAYLNFPPTQSDHPDIRQ